MARTEPEPTTADPGTLFSAYLHWYRETAIAKVTALDDAAQRTSLVPTGWTPLELLVHLSFMEQRWFVWGFLGEQVAEPWGEDRDGRWHVPETVRTEDVVRRLRSVGDRTREVLARHRLDEVAALGGRFTEDPPTLSWICFHVLQESARHVGHLDVVVELAGGPTGE
jgi:hypothetical protein